GVQWCSQFVAHARQELTLQLSRALHFTVTDFQFMLLPLNLLPCVSARTDVVHKSVEPPTVPDANGRYCQFHREFVPLFVQSHRFGSLIQNRGLTSGDESFHFT